MKILICGLPGSGKTTLAKALAPSINAVHLNADEIRREINKDLGFTQADRLEQARRMGVLADIVARSGQHVIADFVCPTEATRAAFNADFIVWVDRIKTSRFPDTDKIWENPASPVDYRVLSGTCVEWNAARIAELVAPVFNPSKPTAMFVGRYQPFHSGHRALIEEGIRRVGQACIAIRSTHGSSDGKNPYTLDEVEELIHRGMAGLAGKYSVVRLPNITNVMYGRDVGYKIEKIELDAATEAVSATAIREQQNQQKQDPSKP